jgi:polar amino acid transport system substrate-binding protein
MRLLYCSLLGAACWPLPGHAVELLTASYAPYTIVDAGSGEIRGVTADKVAELMRRSGEPITLKVRPWARSLQQVQFDVNSCAFPMVRTPQREPLFKWVGPLAVNEYAVFSRVRSGATAPNLAALKLSVIGTKRRDAATEYLTAMGYRVDSVATDIDNPRKLMLGRFDYWATAKLVGLDILRKQGLDRDITPLFVFMHADLYLACHRSVRDDKIAYWMQTLKRMDNDGSTLAIEKKYPVYRRSAGGESWSPAK